ncbi:hypothetical protein P7K49_030163 [Saguinus oedipus]|uniref:Uncharacterized protein n=1 Tax=Saguinus oedipus TaxID=9490 RepID=A0ABQ9U284_SAGOE|nr:hypothetical protein P7K49_030163 [Saguinus oedipus]
MSMSQCAKEGVAFITKNALYFPPGTKIEEYASTHQSSPQAEMLLSVWSQLCQSLFLPSESDLEPEMEELEGIKTWTSDHPSSSTDISPSAEPSDDFTELPSPENQTSTPTEDDIPPCPSPTAPADASSRSFSPDLDPDATPSD